MLDCAVINEGWNAAVDWEIVSETALAGAIASTPYAHFASIPVSVEISIRLTSDAEVQSLNAAYRDKDKPTNVLSFPMFDVEDLDRIASLPGEVMLGDIVLAQGVCTTEAADKGITVQAHATHLIVHGLLHLLGYDHMGDEEALEMETIERRVLAQLGLHDPYGDE
jgi:probable rRNA maturation factor